MLRDRLELMDRADRNKVAESIHRLINGLDDPNLAEHVPEHLLDKASSKRSKWPRSSCLSLIRRRF